jgi:hypothetical protein
MVMDVRFPVFVREKDSGDVFMSESINELQKHVERIDIENSEYEGWDADGRRIQFGLQQPVWLTLDASGETEMSALRAAVAAYAATRGIAVTDKYQSATELAKILEAPPHPRKG